MPPADAAGEPLALPQ